MNRYEKEIIREMCKECSIKEKIIILLFKKVFLKIYKTGVTFGFNNK